MYSVENYSITRINLQFKEIRNFIQKNYDTGFNEHIHWGRLDWMMAHSYLVVDRLPVIALFRDKGGRLVGVVLYIKIGL